MLAAMRLASSRAGGLMSYGLDVKENGRRVVAYVDRILRGAQPKDMPV
jgi:putative ABC transport system substrate-binding protein